MINLTDIPKFFLQAVLHHPDSDLKCRKPQAFAVIKHISDMNTSNFGKTQRDADNGYFWSKPYDLTHTIQSDFPAVFLVEHSHSNRGNFTHQPKTCLKYSLIVADKIDTDCLTSGVGCDECTSRSFNELRADTHQIAVNICHYLKTIVKATVDGVEQYLPRPYYDYLVANPDGRVISKVNQTKSFFKEFENEDYESYGSFADHGIDDMHGTEFRFDICVSQCPETGFNFDPDIVTRTFQSCCG